jgi:hypothetical protein
VLAVYALIIPVSHSIFEVLNSELKDKEREFEEKKKNLSTDSKSDEVKDLKDLIKEIDSIKNFPEYLLKIVMFSFILFFTSLLYDSMYLISPSPSESLGYILVGLFISAVCMFFIVGLFAIFNVYPSMKREFEGLTERQKNLPTFK